MAIRVKWDEYETALLIDTFWEIEKNYSQKQELIAALSANLRQMAINEGKMIDEKYRNVNGITMQLSPIGHGFFPDRPTLTSSVMFEKMIALYKDDRTVFDEYLAVAKAKVKVKGETEMSEPQTGVLSFEEWSVGKFSKKYSVSALKFALMEANTFIIDHKMSKKSIFENDNVSEVSSLLSSIVGMRFYRNMHPMTSKVLDVAVPLYRRYLAYKDECCGNAQKTINSEETSTAKESTNYSALTSLIKSHFPYGIKLDSLRDIMRLRNFAEEDEIDLSHDDEELKAQILSCGMLIDGKVYIKSNDMAQELNGIILDAFASGAEVIYYEALFNKSSAWMAENFITSEEMLKDYLKQNLSQYIYSKVFLLNGVKKTEKEIVTEEIKRVWGDGQLCSVDDLAERLPFIPKGNIWRVISGNRHFALLSDAVYLRVDRFVISEQEKEEIRIFVENECKGKGFASLNDLPLGDIPEQNFELSEVTIYNAIYNLLLADTYQRRDKILTCDGTALDAISLLTKQIAGKEECSFSEIAEEVIRLTGGSNRQYAFEALYSSMVRTDLDKFVADKFVSFNAEEIDSVLSEMIPEHFCAIKDITTFAMFPICGMPWNHFLLESYCYRFSEKYTLNIKNFNDKNAGIIVEKSFNKSYIDMLAIAVAKSDTLLEPEAIGVYLNKVGYLAKSKYGNLDEIAEMAKKLREG